MSSAAETSGGSEMFWMMNLGIATPMSAKAVVNVPASVSEIFCWLAARSSIGTPEVASAVPTSLTIFSRRKSWTSSVVKLGSVPTSWRSSAAGSVT